ncbi:MAG TPA: hypothetical protein VFA18_11265, partial [Gemmataceae bacterium]|nr:hypothetical protein [Gemmataceae bacterium]
LYLALPAAGLSLTGVLAFSSGIVLGSLTRVSWQHFHLGPYEFQDPLCALMCCGGLLVALGALLMMSLRGYTFAVMAALLAILPWSPAWIIGLPFGIWSLVALRRRSVLSAYFGSHGVMAAPVPPAPRGSGGVHSFVRSFIHYFVPTTPPSSEPEEVEEVPARAPRKSP